MKKITLLIVVGLLLGSLTLCTADNTDITDLYSIPDKPVVDTNFEIRARAVDNDGIQKMKLYINGDLEDTKDCDNDDVCTAHFDVRVDEPGTYEFKVKAIGIEGNGTETETDKIDVFVRADSADAPYITAYVSPSQPQAGQAFSIYATASDLDGIYKMEVRHGGSVIGTQYCGYTSPCSRTFSISPKYTPGTYSFEIKAYDQDGATDSTTLGVYVQSSAYCIGEGQSVGIYPGAAMCCSGLSLISCSSPGVGGACSPCVGASICANCGNGVCGPGENKCNCPQDCSYVPPAPVAYCGDRSCNNGETCSSCPLDCGSCQPINYCGDRSCNNGETCSSCPGDCGSCQQRTLPVIIYTCEQKGGECCNNGGTGIVSGAADCPSTCFSQCNAAPAPVVGPTPVTPTGGAIVLDTSTVLFGMMALMLVLVLFIAAKAR